MNDLRVSLIVIGVLTVSVVYFIGWINQRRRRSVHERHREPSFSAEPATTTGFDAADFQVRFKDDDDALLFSEPAEAPPIIPAFAMKKAEPEPPVPARAIEPRRVSARKDGPTAENSHTPELVVVLNVVARESQPFLGGSILRTLETLGLELGKLNLFHYYDTDGHGVRHTVFNVASMIKPGAFDRATLLTYTTPGLTLFMQIPGPLAASEAFDAMNECAGSIAVRLGGMVCDEHRVPLTPQRARELREKLLARDFSQAVHAADNIPARERH